MTASCRCVQETSETGAAAKKKPLSREEERLGNQRRRTASATTQGVGTVAIVLRIREAI